MTFPEKSRAAYSEPFNEAFDATNSLFNSPACEAVYCFFWSLQVLRVNGYYVRTNKEKIDDYRRWNLKLKWRPEAHLQLQIITVGAAKDNKMKIFAIVTLNHQFEMVLKF